MSCNPCYSSNPCFGNHPNNPSVINCGVDPYYARKTNTNYVHYVGPNLPCINVTTCETLTVIIQKIDAALCGDNLNQTIINTILNNTDIRNQWQTIINSLIQCSTVIACIPTTTTTSTSSTSTTTTTTTQCVCSTYAVFNDYDFPINTQFVDCDGNVISTSVGCNCDPIIICACESSIDPNSLLTFVKLSDDCVNIPKLPNCAVLLNEKNGVNSKIYYYNVLNNTSTSLIVPGIIESDDIAHTITKLWMYEVSGADTLIHEWDITLNPFTAIFNRIITVPGFIFGKGLCAKDNTTLITSDNNTEDIYEIDITTNTGVTSYQFSMGLGKYVTGDMVLTTTGKLIVTNTETSNKYISQFVYSSGSLEIDIDITSASGSATSLFESGTDIYVGFCESIAATSYVANYLKDWPYNVISTDVLGYCPSGGSIPPECATEHFLTTTTTTTSTPLCYCYEIDASLIEATIEWIDCVDGLQTQTIDGTIAHVCAEQGTVNVTFSSGPVTPVQGSLCSQSSDCWPALELQATGIDQMLIRQVLVYGGSDWMIEWGDGNSNYFTGSQTFSNGGPGQHIYSSSFSGIIKLKAPSLSVFRSIDTSSALGYQSFTTGSVTLLGSEFEKLTDLESILNYTWILNSTALQVPRNLDNLFSQKGQITGTISQLPATLTLITLLGNETNTLSGDTSDFPTGMTIIRIDGDNTISGSINSFPGTFDTQLVRFILGGNNDISGNLNEFSTYTALIELDVKGYNTITGSICNLSTLTGMQRLVITGYSYPFGDVSCLTGMTSLITLQFENNQNDPFLPVTAGNTLTGDIDDIPDSVRFCVIGGKNTLSGDVANMPDATGSTTATFNVIGSNTISGLISSIKPAYQTFVLEGENSLSGDVSTIPTNIRRFVVSATGAGDISGIIGNLGLIPTNIIQFELIGNHQVNTYLPSPGPNRTWQPNLNVFRVVPDDRVTYAIPTAELDQLLQDLSVTSWAETSSYPINKLELVGSRSIPATNVYVTTLQSPPRDVVVTVGP